MKHWYAKELSKLTQVSVRTLHHYDRIDLLKPSFRQPNGYRLYSEKDLLRLQQIIALKFFGFELSQIKVLLSCHDDVLKHFSMQSEFLRKKAESLLEASTILERITGDCNDNTSLPWEKLIQIIEVYHMTQQLEDSWVKEIFTPEELKQYATFEAEMKSRSTPEQKALFEKNWFNLVEEVKKSLGQDPTSQYGISLGKRFMDFVNNLYGKKYAHLRTKKFEKGFGEGKGLEQHGLTPELVAWIDKAMDAYWRERIYAILAKAGTTPPSELLILWNEVMDDMYGEDEERKAAIIPVTLQDDKVSQEAKLWLTNTFAS